MEDRAAVAGRGLVLSERKSSDRWQKRVVEHEMDMNRIEPRSSVMGWLIDLARRLMGFEHAVVRPPRRAVQRESEESWPTRD